MLKVTDTAKADVTLNTAYNRYKAVVSGNTVNWVFEYTLNNSSFTADQWAAINSGITAQGVSQINDIANKADRNNATQEIVAKKMTATVYKVSTAGNAVIDGTEWGLDAFNGSLRLITNRSNTDIEIDVPANRSVKFYNGTTKVAEINKDEIVTTSFKKTGNSYTLSLPTLTANRTIATTNQIPTVDSSLSTTSTNPVRNSVVTNAINDKMFGSVSLLYGGNPAVNSQHTVTSINNYKFILLNIKLGSYWVSNIFSVSMLTNEISAYGNCEVSVEDNNKDNWKYCRLKFTSATSLTVTGKDSIDWLYVYGVS